jgi:hypothetical protein
VWCARLVDCPVLHCRVVLKKPVLCRHWCGRLLPRGWGASGAAGAARDGKNARVTRVCQALQPQYLADIF